MGEQGSDGISWCRYTHNIWRGCEKISPGCKNCYAEAMDVRFDHGNWGRTAPRHTFAPAHYRRPFAWDKTAAKEGVRERVFCGSVMDICEIHALQDIADIQAILRDELWDTIRATTNLDWLLLTKRPENFPAILPWYQDGSEPWPNVWLGVTAENQEYADRRISILRELRAAKRFVSYEPALGPIDWQVELAKDRTPLPDLVIFGDESGRGRRPAELEWARATRDACAAAGVGFHFKQFNRVRLPVLDGRQHKEMSR